MQKSLVRRWLSAAAAARLWGHCGSIISLKAAAHMPGHVNNLLLAALRAHAPRRICDVNAQGPLSARKTLAALGDVEQYTAIVFGRDKSWQSEARIRVLHATPAYTVRINGVEEQLGLCDAIIVRHEADTAAARTAILLELTVLLQHASARGLVALTAAACGSRPPGLYSGPFWMFNLTEPCATDRFHALSAAGTLADANCTSSGDEVLCLGTSAERASACARQAPLLEHWNDLSTAADGHAVGILRSVAVSGALHACAVRKHVVRVASRSWLWSKATHSRSTLSHLYRRHLRYFSVMPCEEDGLDQVLIAPVAHDCS